MEDEDAPQDPDLGRGEADTVRVGHQGRHPLHEPANVLVGGLDLARLHSEHRIRVLTDLGEREPPARLLLRVELFVPNLSGVFLHRRKCMGRIEAWTGAIGTRS